MIIENTNLDGFIVRLSKIVEAHIADDQFGVNELAAKTGLSRSHIHRKLKSVSNKSVSQFIREVRLEKAKEFLGKENFTVSEIAYKVGFGSPSYFIKSFHDYFGYPPGEYLKYASEDSGKQEKPVYNENTSSNTPEVVKKGKFLKLIFSLTVFISAVAIIYLIFQNRNIRETQNPGENSIVILPLEYIGDEQDIKILADGIMEEIMNRLSGLVGLTVKSRNSAEIYRNSTKKTKLIAKELGVSYVLRGTLLKEGKKVRIYFQLVDVTQDNLIWDDNFEEDLHGILVLVSNVSEKIAGKLQILLSSDESRRLNEVYKVDTSAYSLFLKANYFHHRGDFNSGIKYYSQALRLDSSFSQALSGLASSYYGLTDYKLYPWEEGFGKAQEFAEKALEMNPDLAEAHLTIGRIEGWINRNWENAENELRKAIEINPNYAAALAYYSSFLYLMGRNMEARSLLDKAIVLEPVTYKSYFQSSEMYYNEGDFLNALKENEKALEIKPDYRWGYIQKFRIYYHLGEYDKAIEAYLKFQEIDTPYKDYSNEILKIYSENGINEVINWIIKTREIPQEFREYVPDSVNHFGIARYYGMLGKSDSALAHLELEYKQGQSVTLDRIKYSYDFKFLHGNPRFNTLLKKMNLPSD